MPEKYVKDLRPGDKTDHYEVLNIRTTPTGAVVAEVRFNDGGDSERVWDEPNHIITVKDKLFDNWEWGIKPEREVVLAYGARAIYKGPGTCDLLWDRQQLCGGTEEQRKEFAKWFKEYGYNAILKLTTDNYLSSSEDKRVSVCLNDWFIVVNPRSSCGYLYIGIYPTDNGDPAFMPSPVPSPVVKPAPKKRTPRAKKPKSY